ncbi:MAG TPA: proline dehydrogenase family protein [Gaiellaceae bacterium]|nr:proline dehydrogenase family protein [Gaiellaceae bacterium]
MALLGRSTLDRTIVRLLPAVPRPVVQRLSARYIAGSTIDDAARVVDELNGQGKLATVDVLGEEITNAGEARAIAGQYHHLLARIDDDDLDSNISIKLTALGLDLDLGLCRENLEAVVRDAKERQSFVRIDMEDSSTTTRTLGLYRDLRELGYENLGVVVQAYLRRTIDDVEGIDNVRLCKGIYVEPPAIAYREFEAVRANYLLVLEKLLAQGSFVGIATHDEYLIVEALRLVRDVPSDRYEFQMLLGVRPDRADALVGAGHRVRIYVPYGTQWYEYSLRRLQENPKIAGYVAGDTLNKLLRRPS